VLLSKPFVHPPPQKKSRLLDFQLVNAASLFSKAWPCDWNQLEVFDGVSVKIADVYGLK